MGKSCFHDGNFHDVLTVNVKMIDEFLCMLTHPPPSAAYMRWWTAPSHYLNQCMVVNWTLKNRLFKILSKIQNFAFTETHLKISSAKWRPFCPGGDELTLFKTLLHVTASLFSSILVSLAASISLYFQKYSCEFLIRKKHNHRSMFFPPCTCHNAIKWRQSQCFISRWQFGGNGGISLIRSISWLLMPWLLASPGHQQPRYWLCKIGKSLSYTRRDSKYLCHLRVVEW